MNFRILIFIAWLLFYIQVSYSQSIQNDVISSAGSTFQTSAHEISWTLGEFIIESFIAREFMVSQGFYQPFFKFEKIPDPDTAGFYILIYPNPTTDIANIKIHDTNDLNRYEFILYDITGRILLNRNDISEREFTLNLSYFATEVMFLKIKKQQDSKYKIFKVIRVNS